MTRVVLAHKLREIRAQLGFTRIEALTPDLQGEYDLGVTSASLGLITNWLPATEVLGEGVFIELGDEGETVADEAFELACLAAEVLELPEPLHDGGDFGGELFEES